MTSPTAIIQYVAKYRLVYDKKNQSLLFNGSIKIPTLWKASFSTGTVGPRVGIFLSPLNTNDGFYLSYSGCHVRATYIGCIGTHARGTITWHLWRDQWKTCAHNRNFPSPDLSGLTVQSRFLYNTASVLKGAIPT